MQLYAKVASALHKCFGLIQRAQGIIIYILRHVAHYYLINFVEGLFSLASKVHWGYTSLHKYFCVQGCYACANPWAHSIYSAQDNLSWLLGPT